MKASHGRFFALKLEQSPIKVDSRNWGVAVELFWRPLLSFSWICSAANTVVCSGAQVYWEVECITIRGTASDRTDAEDVDKIHSLVREGIFMSWNWKVARENELHCFPSFSIQWRNQICPMSYRSQNFSQTFPFNHHKSHNESFMYVLKEFRVVIFKLFWHHILYSWFMKVRFGRLVELKGYLRKKFISTTTSDCSHAECVRLFPYRKTITANILPYNVIHKVYGGSRFLLYYKRILNTGFE